MKNLALIREAADVVRELRALAARNRAGELGPKVLLEFEVNSLAEAIEKAKRSDGEDDLQSCLMEGKKLLYRLRQSHPSEDPAKDAVVSSEPGCCSY